MNPLHSKSVFSYVGLASASISLAATLYFSITLLSREESQSLSAFLIPSVLLVLVAILIRKPLPLFIAFLLSAPLLGALEPGQS
ncbi:hypothetical protein [Paenibacillus sp. GCM10012303]|uniref:hypothetical protein n=1 Tax=Paenibacillus sp. GCM10012303 TaxID=3317340 RepID=UPI0036192325